MTNYPGLNSTARRKRRRLIFDLQGGKCFWCPRELTIEIATLDELQPRSRGGTQRLTNVVVSCAPCNRGRGNRIAPKWAFRRVLAREEQRT